MASLGKTMKSTEEDNPIIAAIHGNCVFADAEYPVKIDHYPGCAVVSPVSSKGTGKIHFPLPWALNPAKDGIILVLGQVDLEVDFKNVPPTTAGVKQSRITKAEIFIGCTLLKSGDWENNTWHLQDLWDEESEQSSQVKRKSPGGLEVTLTIEFGEDSLQFCSVALLKKKGM